MTIQIIPKYGVSLSISEEIEVRDLLEKAGVRYREREREREPVATLESIKRKISDVVTILESIQ